MYNVYDVLHVQPRLHKKLKKPQETLAKALLASGKLRLDADNESNFTRFLMPKERINLTFSFREMSDPVLLAQSRQRLMKVLLERHSEQDANTIANDYIERIHANLKKLRPVSAKVEIMMARALVSCNALPVIRLIHLEKAEIYISYGHTVSDVMDIATWQEVGESNGLQSFGRGENAVYVSCGGHPFLEGDERNHSGDGFPALARFIVIAGQETGHNGDMIRDDKGQWAGRYSAIDWSRAPSEKAGKGRRKDVKRAEHLYQLSQRLGLNAIVEWERHLKFYHENKLHNWRSRLTWLKSRIAWSVFKLLMRAKGAKGVLTIHKDRYPATLLSLFFRDMLFNLTPQADAYTRSDPLAQETIIVIEAVARVPQQVVKWGHEAVQSMIPSLYKLYYGTIVPACDKACQLYK